MISKRLYWLLIVLILGVYVAGMLVTLFENDSAQFAVMAMRMVQENDFVNLFKGPEEYLDKPHLHYWLAAIAFKIFGIHDWAYRIPAILATLLGGYSCYGLGKVLYNSDTGKLAALIFLSAQTIVLSVIDVRTDAVLTGFTILSIWQLVLYIKYNGLWNIVLGAIAAGLAFSTKGQIALVVILLPILCYLAYAKKWKVLANWKVVLALFVFALTITPMLYAYYQQFDLHPEKIIRGKAARSGFRFIFWEQSFERLSGEGVGKNSSDYFFFFHTFLWVFLPWTVLGLIAYGAGIKQFIRGGLKSKNNGELLTLGGIGLIFILISFAQFKLPHYLNITIPLFAVLTSAYLVGLLKNGQTKLLVLLAKVQYGIFVLCIVVAALLILYVFTARTIWIPGLVLILIAGAVFISKNQDTSFKRLVTISVFAAVVLNAVLNLSFYPNLLRFQGGSSMAKIVEEKEIPVDKIYKLSDAHTWSLDFYNKKPVRKITVESIKNQHNIWVYATDRELDLLRKTGLSWSQQFTVDQFRITRLQGRFLNKATRENVLNKRHLIYLN